MRLYKYLAPAWADRMVHDGAVRVGTLYDFRRIEALGEERGDSDEGVRISLTDGKAGLLQGDKLPWFVRETLRIPAGVKIQFEEGAVLKVHQHAPDAYVYCTCSRFDAALMNRFGGACVEIRDAAMYFQAVSHALGGWTAEGVRKVTSFQLAPCLYQAREQTWPHVTPYNPVFRKPPAYAHQAEVRATWAAASSRIEPTNLIAPEILRWCIRIA